VPKLIKSFGVNYLIAIFFLSLLAIPFWPGIIIQDAIDVFRQLFGVIPWHDQHRITLTWLTWITTDVSNGKTYYLIFQIFYVGFFSVFGVTVGIDYFFSFLPEKRKSGLALLILLPLLIFPPSGLLNLTFNKDVLSTWPLFTLLIFTGCYWSPQMNEKKALYFLMASSFLAALSMHFRANAFTIALPLLIIALIKALHFFPAIKGKVISAFICLLIFSVTYGIRPVLLRVTSPLGNGWLLKDATSIALLHDFLIGTKFFNLPLSGQQKKILDELIDVEHARFSPENSQYQQFENFISKQNANEIAKSQLENLAWEVLKSHPIYWLKIKISYAKEMLTPPVLGPPGSEDRFKIDERVSFSLDARYGKLRQCIRGFLGTWEDTGYTIREHKLPWLLGWSFYPCLLLHIISVVLLITLRRVKPYRFFLLLPTITSLLNYIPLNLLSVANVFRYNWPIVPFTYSILLFWGLALSSSKKKY
jgi:hypothetical protein